MVTLQLDLHLPGCHSLKEKRAVIKTILHGASNRFGVAGAEVGHQDKWQRAALGFAVVSAQASHADDVMWKVERFALSFPEVELIDEEWGTGA